MFNQLHFGENKGAFVRHLVSLALVLSMLAPMVLTSVPIVEANTNVGGPIISDTTWTLANSPYIVVASVEVWEDVTLTIEAGVTVKFDSEKKLQVNGELIAQGTPNSPITFTSNQADPAPGDWGNIELTETAITTTMDAEGNYISGSILQYCVVEYAGASADSAIDVHSLLIDHCTVRNNDTSGIYDVGTETAPALITNNTVNGNSVHNYYQGTYFDAYGGGIYASYGRVISNIVSSNTLIGYDVYGGGIYASDSTVTNNIVTANTAEANGAFGNPYGGGIYASSSTVMNNVVNGNDLAGGWHGYGGGIYASNSATTSNIVSGNELGGGDYGYGGGIYASGGTVRDNTVNLNSAGKGGGIYASGGTVTGNTVRGNTVTRGYDRHTYGGGIYASNSTVTNNIVRANTATAQSRGDAPCAYGGGIYASGSTVTSNVVDDNVAMATGYPDYNWASTYAYAGGIYASGTTVLSNTVSSNDVTATSDYPHSEGSGIYFSGSSDFLYNTVVSNGTYSPITIIGGVAIDGTPQVHHNNFFGNEPYDVTIVSSDDISGTNNYWGTVSSVDILSQVYDWYDDSSRGKFLYVPYLQDPDPDAPVPPPMNLQATVGDSSVTLGWDAIPSTTTGYGYKVYYDTDASGPPYNGVDLDQGASPIDVGDTTNYTLTGLSPGWCHLAVTAYDTHGLESWYSNEVAIAVEPGPGDTTAPDPVIDLTVSESTTDSITLIWTAPGDDGNVGTASTYNIRYSTSEITEANWDSATQCTGEPAPQPAGSTESFVVTGLSADTTYYFALKTADEVPNWSGLSNVPSGTTEALPENQPPTAYASDISDQPQTMYPDTVYSVTAKYYDPDGRGDLKYCYLQLRHPSKPVTMMWNQSDGSYSPWAGEEGANYLTITSVTSTELANGYELTWSFRINDNWPQADNSIDFGVSARDDDDLESGWDYDNSNASFKLEAEEPDLGFRPNPDGYSFSNYGGLNYNDYTIGDMRRMFGDAAVCRMVGSLCFPKWAALMWNIRAHWYMKGGHCDGFTTTSLRFFKDLDTPADFQTGANTTHDLQLGNARQHIAYYWVLQVPNPVAAARNQSLQKTPSQVLDQLRSAMSGGATDPTTLIVYNTDRTSGHSITPYAIEDRSGGEYWVTVYDNNHPNDANRYVAINANTNTWSYNLGGGIGTWSGDADSQSLGVIPISTYAQQPECPWCDGAGMLSGSPSGQVWLTGEGHLLITDSQGRRIGYVGDQFVNEVPGAFGSVPPGGLGIPVEPIYTLPLADTYSILLDGQTLAQTGTVQVTQFGPGYAAWVDDVTLGPASQDQLTIAPDGTQLAYQSSGDKEATLTLALDGASESNQLQVNGADIGAGQVVTLTADVSNGQLVFNNAQAGGGEYNLEVRRVSAAGEQRFAYANLVISATDTHYADYGAWDGSGSVTLYVDHSSDGTIDETLVLENQVRRVYLPLILRNR